MKSRKNEYIVPLFLSNSSDSINTEKKIYVH